MPEPRTPSAGASAGAWEEPCVGASDTMMSIRQRKGGRAAGAAGDGAAPQEDQQEDQQEDAAREPKLPSEGGTSRRLWKILSFTVGGAIALCAGLLTSVYLATLHENDLWFSNIKEVEREISFRTECGLYYSYYKQMLQAPSLMQGFRGLMYDNKTESMRTINLLQRMNIYQEVFLSAVYRALPIQVCRAVRVEWLRAGERQHLPFPVEVWRWLF
uniref:Dpy-19 like C-mannosyltransferase 3 n=1 Tax=Pipistrellus kuhlii TaxID=59472 RepID=A0A7J7RKZ9_PIPKU|nr:hypothetical protein mPipKuh1_010517 [Pipistrellus kuhlii]